jgi:hypothetical protein
VLSAKRSVERYPDAPILSPNDGARIDLLLWYDDQRELIRDADLRSRSCRKGRYAPPVHMINLTETPKITPYKVGASR